MKIKNILLAALLCFVASSVQAQLNKGGTGPRNPDDLRREVEIFNGCASKVVTLNGTATSTQITTGSGVLAGIEITSYNTAGQTTATPFAIEVFDVAATADINGFTSAKLVADQLGGGVSGAPTQPGARNNPFRPVQFSNGIALRWASSADKGSVAVYWIK